MLSAHLEQAVEALRVRTVSSKYALQCLCRRSVHDWSSVPENSKLKRCTRCKILVIWKLRNSPKKALASVAEIVGDDRLSHPGPYSNNVVTANVQISEQLRWQRSVGKATVTIRLAVKIPPVGDYKGVPSVLARLGWWTEAAQVGSSRYEELMALAAKYVNSDPLTLYRKLRKAVRGNHWKPDWWEQAKANE